MTVLHVLRYGAWLVGQVVVAATEVIADNLRIRQRQRPVLVGLPLRVGSRAEITAFGASITMTPGTLVCGVREADPSPSDGLVPAAPGEPPRFFVIHCIFGGDPAALVESFQEMEEKLAPRVRALPRPRGFLFDEYDPAVQPDPRAYIGTSAETRDAGLWRGAVTPIVSGEEEVRP